MLSYDFCLMPEHSVFVGHFTAALMARADVCLLAVCVLLLPVACLGRGFLKQPLPASVPAEAVVQTAYGPVMGNVYEKYRLWQGALAALVRALHRLTGEQAFPSLRLLWAG